MNEIVFRYGDAVLIAKKDVFCLNFRRSFVQHRQRQEQKWKERRRQGMRREGRGSQEEAEEEGEEEEARHSVDN